MTDARKETRSKYSSSVEYHCKEKSIDDSKFNFVITAKIFNFSNEKIHRPSKKSSYERKRKYIRFEVFEPEMYANGKRDADKGYLSILFEATLNRLSEFRCFDMYGSVAVVDVFDKRRYLQSFKISHHEIEEVMPDAGSYPFSKYISRSTLLSNPSEFLPDDCLTLEIEIAFKSEESVSENVSYKEFYDNIKLDEISGKTKLLLDTDFGRKLSEESGVLSNSEFQRLSGNCIFIPDDEQRAFKVVFKMMMESSVLLDCDVILSMCKIADKYNIPTLLNTCKYFIESVYFLEHPDVENRTKEQIMLDFCEKFNDDHLKDILLRSAESKSNWKRRKYSETEWVCQNNYVHGDDHFYSFYKKDEAPKEESEFQFYQ